MCFGLFHPAICTGAVKQNVIAAEFKALGVFDPLFKACDEFHIHIKNPSANTTLGVAMAVGDVIEPIGAPGDLQPADLPHLGQQIQIAIDRGPADGWMLPDDFFINLFRCRMTLQPIHCLQNQSALDGISSRHESHLIRNDFLLIVYINKMGLSSDFLKK